MKKNKTNIFTKILLLLFIAFLCLYSVSMNGYIEGVNKKKTLYMESQVNKFESDVEKGEDLNLKEYVLDNDINYANKVSEFGASLSEVINYSASKSLELAKTFFSYLFE